MGGNVFRHSLAVLGLGELQAVRSSLVAVRGAVLEELVPLLEATCPLCPLLL